MLIIHEFFWGKGLPCPTLVCTKIWDHLAFFFHPHSKELELGIIALN
jgi:hypothetical protein